jgi:hypothetical protein
MLEGGNQGTIMTTTSSMGANDCFLDAASVSARGIPLVRGHSA